MRRALSIAAVLAGLVSAAFAETVVTFRVGDAFDLRVGGVPSEFAQEFALQFVVGQEGTVNVPMIGEVKAAGLTTTQLERAFQNRLVDRKIFTQPTVMVSPVQGARAISVSGSVRIPQRLPWSSDLTLSSAIGNCGGLTEWANPKKIQIRVIRDAKVFGTFNLKEAQDKPERDPKLLPGDQVIVPE